MDSIVSSALEEICSHGNTGLSSTSLWSKLSQSSPLSSSVKASIWRNLLLVPSLQFKTESAVYRPSDPPIQRLEDVERLNLRIVANEQLRDNFVGLYDVPSNISSTQRRALERLAAARTNGITQNQLAKEFGIEGKNLFYIVRNLECRGLIVRQPAVVRTKEPCSEGESKNSSCVMTNMMYLYRYAKHLGSQQRFEISKEDDTAETIGKEGETGVGGDGSAPECVKEDVLIKDYLPAMKAICDKLEEANGKVLVVSDIKHDLGYTGSHSGHKAWRSICRRLKDVHIVEEFDAIVNEKVVHCLRLLKNFSPKDFEPTSTGCGDNVDEQQLKFGRTFRNTDQLVELPIEHQIHDMVDAEGCQGLAVMEVCERLGIDKKRNYSRLCNMFSRFGMHLQAESHRKTTAFRVWTSGNSNAGPSNIFHSKSENVKSENQISNLDDRSFLDHNHSTSEGDFATHGKMDDKEIDVEISHGSAQENKTNSMLLSPGNRQESVHETCNTTPDGEPDIARMVTEVTVSPSETKPLAVWNPLESRVHQTYPLTADNARREQRILERLQDEKFILRAELYRWLVSLEKDKDTKMDRKTIDRILNKLQLQGHCKCMAINVPIVTNCGRNRSSVVVLHPSVQSLTPELLGEIHDRLRSFEIQSRGQGSSRWKNNESVPVLNDVQRTQNHVGSDARASRSEAMRANGFVLAKMVRAKLLHGFLWGFLSASSGWDDALSSANHLRTYSLFSLEAAIKSIPLELFLQVAGSTQKFDDMVEKCKRGLRLSDLPAEEYRFLMDTSATGRLSMVIDILRRLKLIRLVSNGHSDEGVKGQHANLTHALELKPYIEEPVSIVTSSLTSFDLRPRIRHDFILSNREAVNEYWLTLEYCYAAADPRAAVQAFPGSVVHEVFLYRSWASVRVMTADQRAELLKRIVKDNPNEKLPFRDCERIAKDLNLTLEQVLRVYYDKHQKRLDRFQGVLNVSEEYQLSENKYSSSSQKRKRSIKARSVNSAGVGTESGQWDKQKVATSSDTVNQFRGEQNLFLASSGEHHANFQAYQDDDYGETLEEAAPSEDESHSLINDSAFAKMKPSRQRRFSWTDEADRQLVIQYVRHRSVLGVKFHRINWASLPELPAPPSICRRRMSSLKRNTKFRKAVMKLCSVLSERYARHLEKQQKELLNNDDCRVLMRPSSREVVGRNISNGIEHAEEIGLEEKPWDDFDDKDIKRALEDVLKLKQMAKLEASKRNGPVSEEWSNINMNLEEYESEMVSPPSHSKDMQNLDEPQQKDSARRSRSYRLHQKFIKLLNEEISISRKVHESLAVSNAVELLKLVFLSTSTAPEMPNLLAQTLQRYSERDLFAAYSYLRDKKIMIGGSSGQPFVLSQQFLHSLSKSPLPINTGKRAAKFCSWLHEREGDLMGGGIHLTADLQCGDIFNLFSLVSSGELSIYPSLPDVGVGEAEDLRSLKRKAEDSELYDADKAKKLRLFTEGELVCRREKGFPGIVVSVHRVTLSTASALELFKDDESRRAEQHGSDEQNIILGQKIGRNASKSGDSCASQSDSMKEILNTDNIISKAGNLGESPWEAMASCAEYLACTPFDEFRVNSFKPEIFKAVFAVIQKAGDQGLSIKEISHVVDIPGKKELESIIDVLQSFGRVLKVNAYDSVRVVDALYRSKYFLTSMACLPQNILPSSAVNSPGRKLGNHGTSNSNPPREVSMDVHDVHKVTILNLPEEGALPKNEIRTSNMQDGSVQGENVSLHENNEGETYKFSCGELCMSILPWINADGTVNSIVYNGLLRRVLGIVMQNPGISEDDIIRRMDVLNPQSCKKLLELMILEGHLHVREIQQVSCSRPPALLSTLVISSFIKSESECRKHFFANPMSTAFL